jgi:hypothetical protein
MGLNWGLRTWVKNGRAGGSVVRVRLGVIFAAAGTCTPGSRQVKEFSGWLVLKTNERRRVR